MKGIILAGGKGTRLYPSTISVSKQLLPIYDKPLIYYPLSTLLLANVFDILVISTPNDIDSYKKLLGDGSRMGIKIQYCVQKEPRGLADAFILGESFIGNDSVCLVLGDNVFYGQFFSGILLKAREEAEKSGACVFGYPVNNPSSFGVVEFDNENNVLSIEEKPKNPRSNYAVPGLYFYCNDVVKIAKNVKPSHRGEVEITSVNNEFLSRGQLKVTLLGRGMVWLDTGTPNGMYKAAGFVKTIQEMQGFYISCIEEIAYKRGLINLNQLEKLGREMEMTEYGKYLLDIVSNERKRCE